MGLYSYVHAHVFLSNVHLFRPVWTQTTQLLDDLTILCNLNIFFKLVNIFLAGCIRGVEGEGMPIYRRSTTNGNLYIKFNVVFPEKNFLDEDKLKVSLQCCKGLVFEYTITL